MRGTVLALVIWLVAVLTVLALGWSRVAAQQARHWSRLRSEQAADDLLLGALRAAIETLQADDDRSADGLHEAWAAPQERAFGPVGDLGVGHCRWRISDEQARLNLNTADAATLARLPGWDRRAAESLLAWRGDLTLDPWIAEDEARYYAWRAADERTLVRRCKGAPLEAMEELLLVRGMTPQRLRAVEPLVTVFGDGAVNVNTASEKVLELVGVSPNVAWRIARHVAGADGVAATADDQPLRGAGDLAQVSGLRQEEVADLMRLFHRRILAGQASAFRLTLEAWWEDDPSSRRRPFGRKQQAVAVVSRVGDAVRCEAWWLSLDEEATPRALLRCSAAPKERRRALAWRHAR